MDNATNKTEQAATIVSASNQLVVPIVVDALFLTKDEAAKRKFTKQSVDFSKLPYINGRERVNANTAFISEEIAGKPFGHTQTLAVGVHLYWQLPPFLKHGYMPEGSDKHIFPSLPDFWLVTRFQQDAPDSEYKKSWLVKSDALDKEGRGTTVLAMQNMDKPFSYLGKTIEIDSIELLAAENKYPLTTIGYGDPAFTSVYTNCQSVFGFYDDLKNISTDANPRLAYQVCGWYSIQSEDPFMVSKNGQSSSFLLDTALSIKSQMLKKAGVDSEYSAALRLLCIGGIASINKKTAEETKEKDFSQLRVFVGNTVEEAVARLLAEGTEPKKRAELEKLLNAFQLGLIQKTDQLDGSKLVDELMQNNRFVSEAGEYRWIIKRKNEQTQSANIEKTDVSSVALSPEMSQQLEQLNQWEQASQAQENKLEALRFQVFCDWYKFMMIHYTDNVVEVRQTPDDDKLRAFILYKTARIQRVEKELQDIKAKASKLKTQMEQALLAKELSDCSLKRTTGPRYWKPKEPVLLFHSPEFADMKSKPAKLALKMPSMAEVISRLFELEKIKSASSNLGVAAGQIGDFYPFLKLLANGELEQFLLFREFEGNAFRQALLMDWEATCYISERNSKENANFYDPDFIQNQYELNEFQVELMPKEGKRYINKFTHSGSTILSATGGESLKYQMESLNLNFSKEGSFFNQIFAQSIGGFNDELLMYKATAQLPIHDPMAETPYLRQFTRFVAQTVGRFNLKAPQPHNHFSPIREGIMQVARVSLVDYFGQVVDLPISAENVLVGTSLSAGLDTDHFYLPPRIVQPSRLHFRWCSALDKTLEAVPGSANSPILGWVLHDKFDNTLTFYHPTGEMLCELNDKDATGKIELIGSNGRLSTYGKSLEQILKPANEHLSSLIKGILAEGAKPMYRFVDQKQKKAETKTYFKCLIEQIDLALSNINPQAEDNSNISMLFGKPLAIVRASLDFQVKGYPSANYSWEKTASFLKWDDQRLAKVMENESFDRELSDGYCDVKLPVKLGDYNKQNDSLVLYFREKQAETDFSGFYANEENSYFSIRSSAHEDYNIYLSVNNPAEYLTMLVYPFGAVHAVTGVLPVKSIDLPSSYYQDFLQNFEISFRIGPVLTNRLDEAYFASYLPKADVERFKIFSSDAQRVVLALEANKLTGRQNWITYMERMDADLIAKFNPLLLSRSIYRSKTDDEINALVLSALDAVQKMVAFIDHVLQNNFSHLISFSKFGEHSEINMAMEKVAKAYFPPAKVAYLLRAAEWEGCKAEHLKKNKKEIEENIQDIVLNMFINLPFETTEKAKAYLNELMDGAAPPEGLVDLIIKQGLEPEAEMYLPVPKSNASLWSFIRSNGSEIEEFNLKDDNTLDQFDSKRVAALEGWLLLKSKA